VQARGRPSLVCPFGGVNVHRTFTTSPPYPCRGNRISGQPSSMTTGVRRCRASPSRPDQYCKPSMARLNRLRCTPACTSMYRRSPARTHVQYPRDNSAGSGIGLRSLATLAPSAIIARGESQGWGEQNSGSPSRPDRLNTAVTYLPPCASC